MVTSIQLGNLFQNNGRNVVTGGSSQLDIEGLVKGLTEARRQPAVLLEKKVETNTKKSEALGELKKIFEDFRDAANFLRNPPGVRNSSDNVFRFRTGSVTTNSGAAGSLYLNVTAQPGAPTGQYDLRINQLATRNVQTTQDFITTGLGDPLVGEPASAFNAGTLLIGPSAVAVTLNAGDSLSQMVGKINAVKNQSGVEASVIQMGGGAYRLSFKTLQTGAAQNYNILTANPSIFNLPFASQTNAVDAQISIDGTTVTRSSNTVSDLIDGLTFNLVATTPPATDLQVNIDADRELAKSGIMNFVDAYNQFRLFASRQTETGTDGRPVENAVLAANRALTGPLASISSELARMVDGIAGSDPKALADIGITFGDYPGDKDTPFTRNILRVDEEKLKSALASNFDGVRRVFEFDVASDNPSVTVFSRSNDLGVSNFTLNVNTVANTYTASFVKNGVTQVVNLTQRSLGGGAMSLTGPDGSPLQGLVLLYTGGTSTVADVNITQGVADRVFNAIDDYLDDKTGAVSGAIDQIKNESDRYQKEIKRIDDQIVKYRDRLLAQYSALEKTISQINTLLQSLDAQTQARNNN
jgi:flagellar hook-associated protein 2